MSEPSKLVIAGAAYHVNAGTLRTVVEQRDALLTALQTLTRLASDDEFEPRGVKGREALNAAHDAIAACE